LVLIRQRTKGRRQKLAKRNGINITKPGIFPGLRRGRAHGLRAVNLREILP
jgi:hypothetical protein